MNGKGSLPRPLNRRKWEAEWERIFRPKKSGDGVELDRWCARVIKSRHYNRVFWWKHNGG